MRVIHVAYSESGWLDEALNWDGMLTPKLPLLPLLLLLDVMLTLLLPLVVLGAINVVATLLLSPELSENGSLPIL